ncbi:hypothetical protein [Microcoleus sp. PH2017_28_MFU_U_A]|nr:hypothetical protein [Microcoleus sp. PH2017_28_MFU_U_A]
MNRSTIEIRSPLFEKCSVRSPARQGKSTRVRSYPVGNRPS